MIAKKVENPKKSSSKAVRICQLSDYILEPEKKNAQEKCIYYGARNFTNEDPYVQTSEMIDLAEKSRSPDPIVHYVLSWPEDEKPTNELVEEAVDIFLKELKMKDHQTIYGLHADTDNYHLHIEINRVHPENHKCIEINNGFDIEAIHIAKARIEIAQGWRIENDTRYKFLEDGKAVRARTDQDKALKPKQKIVDMEHRTGEKSDIRTALETENEKIKTAIERGAPKILKGAETWEQLHRELASKNLRYETKGNGAVIIVDDVPVKASSVERSASFSKMVRRLGAFEPAPQLTPTRVASKEPEKPEKLTPKETQQSAPIKQNMPDLVQYTTKRKKYYRDKYEAKSTLDKRHEAERKALYESQKTRRQEVLKGNWKGKRNELNALRSVLAAEQAAEKTALREKHAQERIQHRQQYPPFPDSKTWFMEQQRPELSEQYRHKDNQLGFISGGDTEAQDKPKPRDIRAFDARIVNGDVYYTHKGDTTNKTAFVDKGNVINVYDSKNPDTVLAAMQLSAEKWKNGFSVSGSQEFINQCVKLAAQHGFKITNPELQEAIQQERQRLRQIEKQITQVAAAKTSQKEIPAPASPTKLSDTENLIVESYKDILARPKIRQDEDAKIYLLASLFKGIGLKAATQEALDEIAKQTGNTGGTGGIVAKALEISQSPTRYQEIALPFEKQKNYTLPS